MNWGNGLRHTGEGCHETARERRLVGTQRVLVNMPPVGDKPGPERVQGDHGYDSEPLRQLVRWLGIKPDLAARNTEHGSGLGVSRWFVERTISWVHSFGRVRRRLDRLTEIQDAFLQLACDTICLRFAVP